MTHVIQLPAPLPVAFAGWLNLQHQDLRERLIEEIRVPGERLRGLRDDQRRGFEAKGRVLGPKGPYNAASEPGVCSVSTIGARLERRCSGFRVKRAARIH